MKVSVEISMYPLLENYEVPILDFLERLNTNDNIEVRTNGMSTQVFGVYDEVMSILQREIKNSFKSGYTFSIVMKILNTDTSGFMNM